MATTLYSFQADLTQLLKLNNQLERANINLKKLKANTLAYSAQAKKVAVMGTTMKKNTTALRGANRSAKALNRTGGRMVAIFKSASIAIVSAFAFRAILGGLRGIITSFANFESQMAAVKAISGATDLEFKKLNDSALELGSSTVFTAKQVGQLQEEYARLGFTADEIVAAQTGTIMLAAATGESLKASAETSGSVIRAFGLDARDTTRVVDIMGESFTSSALNLNRFRESMKFVAPVAKAAGFTLEETSAMLAKLADNGLHGSIAGNALKNIMLRLGDANSSLNKKLGKTVQGLPQFIEALKGMKEESFGLTEAVQLLDKRSAPAFLALIENIDGLGDQLETLNSAEGAVSKMSKIRLNTLEGDFTLLKSATEGLGVAIGSVFENSLRQSIFSLTEWTQKMANSDAVMSGLKTSFTVVSNVLKGLLIRFALMKLASLQLTFSFSGLFKGVRLLAISIRGLATNTMTASTAMKGFRAALASTGVGLLVVGLGALVGYMMSLGEETSSTVHEMDRLHVAFEKDLKKVTQLNVENEERVGLLRKLNQDYPELIGNIDLETASNTQLLEVLKVINNTRAERTLIADKQVLIDKIYEEAAGEAFVHQERLLSLQASKEHGKLTAYDLMLTNKAIKSQEKKIKVIMDAAKKEERIILKDIKVYMAMIERKKKANGTWRRLDTKEEEKYRMKLRKGYLKDLEDFRSISDKLEKDKKGQSNKDKIRLTNLAIAKQKKEISDTRAEKHGLEQTLKYHAIKSKIGIGTDAQIAATGRKMVAFTKTLKAGEERDMKKAKDLNKMGIKVTELRTKIVNLSASLIKSGKASDQGALGVHRLQTTKNRIKELLELKIEAITDVEERERRGVEVGFEKQVLKYEKEKLLIKANIGTIADYISGNAANQNALNKEFIKKNRQKYDVLKNLDSAGWDALNDSTEAGIERRNQALRDMRDEEVEKAYTNSDVIKQIAIDEQRALAILDVEQSENKLGHQKQALKTEMDQLDSGFESIFRNNKEFREKLTEQTNTALDNNQANVDLGVITEAEGAANKLAINKDLSDELNKLEDQRLAKIKEVYGKIAASIMEVSANMAAVESERVESDAERAQTIEQDKFDRQLQIAEKAGKDTEGMKKKHDIKMKAIEEQKNIDLTEIKRKQFMMQKANDLIMATINGALAITKVTAQTGVGAIAAVPITAALVGAQIGAIASRQFVGEQGGLTPTKTSDGSLDKFASGGMVEGASHKNGGVKFASGGRVVELEGGEAVINKRSTKMFKPMLSKMNSHNGYGKKFAEGGLTPGMRSTMDSAKDNWTANDIAGLISGSINNQQVFVTESDISSSQSTVDIIEGNASIF